ncbi:MAG: glycosyltransferase family 61 protein, partial [Blastopirellula sp. JB062]
MRFKSETVKKLRGRLLNAWWRQTGVAAPTETSFAYPPATEVEAAFTRSYPQRATYGAVDQVDAAIEPLISAGLLNSSDRRWNGETSVNYPAGSVYVLEQASVISRQGILYDQDGVVLESLGGGALASVFDAGRPRRYLPRPRKVSGNLLVMARGVAQRNYYHWTFDMLSQLRLIEQAGITVDYVAAPKRHSFAADSLRLLGFKRSQIIPVGHYTHLRADQLIVPSVACYYPHPAGVAYLHKQMDSQRWSHTRTEKRLKLYIARRRLSSRHIVNEAELFASLKPLGFQRVYLENLSLQKQIQLFQQADAVVGPHGAGF